MKQKFLLIIFLITGFLNGCAHHDQVEDLPLYEQKPITKPDSLIEANFLNAPIFLNLKNHTSIYLPQQIEAHSIKWQYDDEMWFTDEQFLRIKKDGKTTIYANVKKANYFYSEAFTFYIKNQKIIQSEQHGLVFYYDFLASNHHKVGPKFTPKMLVIHNTANTASAYNEIRYLHNPTNKNKTSYHFAVDDVAIYQAIPTTNYAYHAGNMEINQKSIGIEIAKSMIKDNKIKDLATEKAIKLTYLLMKTFNIHNDNVITHQDASGKNCPHDVINRYGMENFLINLQKENVLLGNKLAIKK